MLRSRSTLGLVLFAAAVAALALVVRWNHISAPPLDFHPDRQFHSFTIARAYYVRGSHSMPVWERRVASANLHDDPPIELPFTELTAAVAYRLAGGEHLWIPRLLSSLFWITGGLFLYLIATSFASRWAALIGVAIYLFLPFPLVASTSFQPDPLMVMLFLAATFAAVRHHEEPTRRRLVAAVALAGLAVLVKPIIAAFFLFPLFAALAIVRDGVRRALKKPSFYVIPAVSFLPAAVLYVYSAITKQFLTGNVEGKVNPRLWGDSFYWRGWLNNIELVLRPPHFGERLSLLVLGGAVLSIPLARTRTQKASLLALWVGYGLFGVVYTNHISSHDYYSLPLVPARGHPRVSLRFRERCHRSSRLSPFRLHS